MRLLLPLLWLCAAGAAASAPAVGDERHGTPATGLRAFFEAVDAGAAAVVAGRRLHHPARLGELYRARNHQPLWSGGGPLQTALGDLLNAIEASTAHGLSPADYHLDALRALRQDPAEAELALELLASDAFVQQVRHRSIGAVSPRELDAGWHMVKPEVDALRVLRSLIGAADGSRTGPAGLSAALDELWPASDEYRALVEHRARLLAIGAVEALPVPPGPLLKPGQSSERIVALKDRLLGPGEHSPVYDDDLQAAVRSFQRAAGLEPDGVVGNATLEVMNATRFSWIDRIDANLERWRWLPREEPETYVRVNIAAYSLRVVRAGEDALRMDVIVGRPYRRTPVFTETIKYMVFNPYWNVPFRLAVQDKLPALKADPASLEAQGFEVRPHGEEHFLPVTRMDWRGVERGNFRHLLRQRPGPQNALGQVKFMLPNPFAVYLHDTPSRELFARTERSFSSGCVRLSRPLELASWILENDGRSGDAGRVADLVASGQTATLYLKKPLPTHLVYFTAFTDDAGEVVFRRDLYSRDAPLVAALRGPST